MSSNSSNTPAATAPKRGLPPLARTIAFCLALPAWVFLGFMLAQVLVLLLVEVLQSIGVPLEQINASLFQVIAGGIIYAFALLIVIGGPYLIRKSRTTKKELGIHRLPTWLDIGWFLIGIPGYVVMTSLVSSIALILLPFIDYTQAQDTGFQNLSGQGEYILAFLMLVVIAPIAEELLFRGYLLGKLRKHAPLWVAIFITSLIFAVVHFAWNVGVDVFALSIVLCILRVASGSLWPSILLHMMKNGLAFYVLFINPTFLSTLGG
jgi:membrane protease YdiL (CAAX protease family)